jgi:hypothetical protein
MESAKWPSGLSNLAQFQTSLIHRAAKRSLFSSRPLK